MLNPFTEMESIWRIQNGKNTFEMSSTICQCGAGEETESGEGVFSNHEVSDSSFSGQNLSPDPGQQGHSLFPQYCC